MRVTDHSGSSCLICCPHSGHLSESHGHRSCPFVHNAVSSFHLLSSFSDLFLYSSPPVNLSLPRDDQTSDPCRFGSPAACATGSTCSHFFSMLHATPPHRSADSALTHQTQAGWGRFRYVRNRANCGALPLTRPGCLLLASPPPCSFF